MFPHKRLAWAAGAAAWVACVVAAFGGLQHYAARPGSAAAPAPTVTTFFAQHRQSGQGLLVMTLHPLCPCSEASLAELGDLLARSRGTCDAVIVEYAPARPPANWPKSAANLKLGGVNVPVVADLDGTVAATLGAKTSGHAVFMAPDGEIRFRGGLTLSRGHRGRSPAQDAILSVLSGRAATLTSAPVYGCALEAECQAEVAR